MHMLDLAPNRIQALEAVLAVSAPISQSYVVERYYPVRVRHLFFVMYCYTENDKRGISLHYGRRTGRPVTFARHSDALRLCEVLNGQREVDA
ncbi:hypothetical protein KDAU_24260 [Dictyobacter aurantiacus]|uniref:Uncharacterized protein n=1 Tax=Dictyobacter aurantiacus TaxID=1936993 RepID=A0A401ZDZ2_9CHLR|nr:hypothetical protein KDAU_24260 [Dictyobacter aurantiacus]